MIFKNIKDKFINTFLGLNQLQQKGSLVYEYNPLRVFRVDKDTTIDGQLYPKGSIVNLDTDLLNFDLNHPVDILPQASYDGSVNLIINDGKNYPKLINSRFSSTGMDTYQIVDREGDNDTNIYDSETFESDISLYKKINNIVDLTFVGLGTDGNLKVGNYVFYFRLSDSDNNETDFIAESGIVTCHIGNINDPLSIQGGLRNENSYKSVNFIMSDIDSSYNHVSVYYTRSTSDIDQNETTESFKILKTYPIYNGIAKIVINGFENTESVSINDINVQYNIVDSALTQASCQNMLFLGNVHKPDIPYLELSDLSLRLKLQLNDSNNIGFIDERYKDSSGQYEYYNAKNIYYKLGYWNNEIYRFGIVYILNDYTLSPVFNLRGVKELTTSTVYTDYKMYLEDGSRNYISYNKETFALDNLNENAKGVFRIKYTKNQLASSGIIPLGLDLEIPEEVKTELKKYTKGFFLVRQKRIPTILCQAVLIGLDLTGHIPLLPIQNNKYLVERFFDNDRLLTHDFGRRTFEISSENMGVGNAALCPEYELKQPFFNQLFTGAQFPIKIAQTYTNKYFSQDNNYFYNLDSKLNESSTYSTANITAIGDNVKIVKGKNILFSARAGEAEEAWRIANYEYVNKSPNATNIVRGSFGPYLGIEGLDNTDLSIINIHIPNYDEFLMDNYFNIRYEDSSAFYAIQDRVSWDNITNEVANIFRGDCFIGNYTHRMNRNFQDPSAPINDDIVDESTWRDNYDLDDEEKYSKINRGDVNAVKLGHWVTVKLFSNVNLAMRCLDYSYSSEEGLTGKPRGFYPIQSMSSTGESKIPESFAMNAGINSTTSDKYNFEQPKVPAIKNIFNTRIIYSDVNITDAFKNGFRTYKSTSYKDYPSTYGSITRLVDWYGNIVAIFEHGVVVIPVNERAIAGKGAGGNVFINTSNVLPENPNVLSDMYGTQWSESVVKTPSFIYGVDTVGKKIWRTNGQVFETISDFKVQKFLNDNITLTESEKTPIIGIRNVKSHYNLFKKDVMFTFYDDLNTLEEKVWNLCYNELQQRFITFYSWVPSYSENIDNIYFSFDRNTSKEIAKLTPNYPLISLSNRTGELEGDKRLLGDLQLNLDISNFNVVFDISETNFKNNYEIVGNKLYVKGSKINDSKHTVPIEAVLTNQGTETVEGNTINVERTLYGTIYYNSEIDKLTTAFWKHGRAGLMRVDIKPTYWYGKQHPFEFEFVVADNPQAHKIFNNLQIISNSAEPESFHYEIVGDSYDFAEDKKNMYIRQEATKELYQNNGCDIVFDHDYTDLVEEHRPIESMQGKFEKSTLLPLYYSRQDTVNEIEDYYHLKDDVPTKNFSALSGGEIVYYKDLNEYRIWTHCKAVDMNKNGRLRGNMQYQEDKWEVQINPMNLVQKNEPQWKNLNNENTSKIPVELRQSPIPDEVLVDEEGNPKTELIIPDSFKEGDGRGYTLWDWTDSQIKESKLKDKYIKIRVRYSGNKLAIISAIKTLYAISYS